MTKFDVATTGYNAPLQAWIDWILKDHGDAGLMDQLAEEVVFFSPVVFTPQKGKAVTFAYLSAAGKTIGGEHFKYTRVYDCGDRAVLEFETQMDGKYVNGVDMIQWNAAGKICEFKVMVRPLQAIQSVHAAMGAMLEKMKQRA